MGPPPNSLAPWNPPDYQQARENLDTARSRQPAPAP